MKKVSGSCAYPQKRYVSGPKKRSTATQKRFNTADASAPNITYSHKEIAMPLIDTRDAYWLWMLLWDGITCAT